ncbi:glucose PTS transporter subunit IIA [Lapidilactobacillus bayanensis]|uniref:glucose PTS transporter subunit IIA n=1 Tax=Lapidilactobacillus bayanensis TaxID=2485998 RepID=UPI000F76D6C5|nr:glucose PTS transporter subunit IIA [Lapidilactobacillus bayanensis]
MKHDEIATAIIKNVGGRENINNAWHCMTRLRFNLKDESKVNYQALEDIPKVVGVKYTNKQLQIVIGTDVADYFEPLAQQLGLDASKQDDQQSAEPAEKKGIVSLFMDTVSGVFGPLVPAIAGAGMIKGLMSGLAALNVISATTPSYQVIDMLASGVFTFLPFFVAASAAKIFKTNQYLAIAIAATLQYPTMTAAAAAGKISQFMLFGIIPVPVFNYAGTIIPIIFAVLLLSYVYRWVDKILPEVLRTVFTPTLSLFIAGLLTLTVIGPIGIYLGDWLGDGVAWLFKVSPVLAGIIAGGTRPLLIFTGLHHAMTPVALQNFANLGYDRLMPTMFMANMSIAGATAAVYFKVNSKKEKSIIVSSVLSGLLGITEPALFGILSKYKKAFVASCCGAAISSAFISFFGVRLYGYILSSVFSIPAYIGKYFVWAMLGIVIALVSSFIIAYVLVPAQDAEPVDVKPDTLSAVADGEYLPLEDVSDDVFSTKMVGAGYALEPKDGNIYSPVTGTIITIANTKHAIGIKADNGAEVLVHMGLDTVELNGKPFTILVNPGDKVTTNTQLAQVDLTAIKAAGKETTIIVVITNKEQIESLQPAKNIEGALRHGDILEEVRLA